MCDREDCKFEAIVKVERIGSGEWGEYCRRHAVAVVTMMGVK
jgi:hypothetical protein